MEDPHKVKEREQAAEYMRLIVTEARVMKIFHKLVDEGILPRKIQKEHLQLIYKNLPKCVYEDCVKEEPEIVQKADKYAGKLCTNITIDIFRKKMGV